MTHRFPERKKRIISLDAYTSELSSSSDENEANMSASAEQSGHDTKDTEYEDSQNDEGAEKA